MKVIKNYTKKEYEYFNINQLNIVDYIEKSKQLNTICIRLGLDIKIAAKTILEYRPFSMNCFFKGVEYKTDILIEENIGFNGFYDNNDEFVRTENFSYYLTDADNLKEDINIILLCMKFPYFQTNPIFQQKKVNINELNLFYLEYYQEPFNLKPILHYNVKQLLDLIDREEWYIDNKQPLPTIISTYKLDTNKDIYIHVNNDDDNNALYVPIDALLNNDWNSIVKRHTEYFTDYYHTWKPERLPIALKLLETPIALELKKILEENKK